MSQVTAVLYRSNPKRDFTRKLFEKDLFQLLLGRMKAGRNRRVTPFQVYVALHEMALQQCEPFALQQVVKTLVTTDKTLDGIVPTVLRREVMQILIEGVVFGWYRCSPDYLFMAEVNPPPKMLLDRIKKIKMRISPSSRIPDRKDLGVVPKNVVLHGEVSDESQVPGFLMTAEEFMAFMHRVGPWSKYKRRPPINSDSDD